MTATNPAANTTYAPSPPPKAGGGRAGQVQTAVQPAARTPSVATQEATRPAPPAPDGGKLSEVGVIGHGPTGEDLAGHVADEIRTWDNNYRHRSVPFAIPDTPAVSDAASGRFVLDHPGRSITVTWQ